MQYDRIALRRKTNSESKEAPAHVSGKYDIYTGLNERKTATTRTIEHISPTDRHIENNEITTQTCDTANNKTELEYTRANNHTHFRYPIQMARWRAKKKGRYGSCWGLKTRAGGNIGAISSWEKGISIRERQEIKF